MRRGGTRQVVLVAQLPKFLCVNNTRKRKIGKWKSIDSPPNWIQFPKIQKETSYMHKSMLSPSIEPEEPSELGQEVFGGSPYIYALLVFDSR